MFNHNFDLNISSLNWCSLVNYYWCVSLYIALILSLNIIRIRSLTIYQTIDSSTLVAQLAVIEVCYRKWRQAAMMHDVY